MNMKAMLTAMAILAIATTANADLVAYYPLSDGSAGTTVTGAVAVINDPVHGATDATASGNGDTWVFDATRNRIVLSTTEGNRLTAGTQDIDVNKGFSWSLWANVASSNTTDPGGDCIIGTRNGGTWHKIDLAQVSNWAGINYPTLADDTWHHIAYAGDRFSVKLYVDGVLKGTDTSPPATHFNGVLEIGGSSRYTEDITGLMSDVAIWDEVLSETRIQELANGGAVPEPATLSLLALCGLGLLRRKRV